VQRSNRSRYQRRRLGGVALVFAGVALVVAAGVVGLGWNRGESGLSRADQSARALLAPVQQGGPTSDFVVGSHTKRYPATGQSSPPGYVEMPVPQFISIPAIAVRAPVTPLGLNSDGTLEVPSSFSETGWFRGGPEPGEPGASIVVGHVDSKAGPGVFYSLRALRRGDVIKISLEGGSIIRFTVRSSFSTPKQGFPTERVYRHEGAPTLELITCDGMFDQSTGHYVDNYVVVAKLTSVHMA
jgi:hypothetical protein